MDAGLEHVVAAETILSKVEGQNGRLIITGYDVETVARDFTFEDIIVRLWSPFFDDIHDTGTVTAELAQARWRAFERLKPHFDMIAQRPGMDGLRLALATCSDGHHSNVALDVLSTLVVATAGAARLRRGKTPITPDVSLSHTEDFLFMLHGEAPKPSYSQGLKAYFNTVCDHGLNASTFAARVVASTQAGLMSAAIAGLSALKGPLHGGAPGPVLDMLDAIAEPERAERWITDKLATGDRLMGFGHRVYKVRDPRANALKQALTGLPQSAGRLALAEHVEQKILNLLSIYKPGQKLETNVEYYTAILLEALGFDRDDFTCVFACARAAGWIAHAREQLATKRIIRPKSHYVGAYEG